MSLDKLAADVADLDPRLRLVRDLPDCLLCGHKIVRMNFISIETGATTPLHAHSECAEGHIGKDGKPDEWLFERLWQAITAAVTGRPEAPNPGPILNFRGEHL